MPISDRQSRRIAFKSLPPLTCTSIVEFDQSGTYEEIVGLMRSAIEIQEGDITPPIADLDRIDIGFYFEEHVDQTVMARCDSWWGFALLAIENMRTVDRIACGDLWKMGPDVMPRAAVCIRLKDDTLLDFDIAFDAFLSVIAIMAEKSLVLSIANQIVEAYVACTEGNGVMDDYLPCFAAFVEDCPSRYRCGIFQSFEGLEAFANELFKDDNPRLMIGIRYKDGVITEQFVADASSISDRLLELHRRIE